MKIGDGISNTNTRKVFDSYKELNIKLPSAVSVNSFISSKDFESMVERTLVLLAKPIEIHKGYPSLILGQSSMLNGSERVMGTFAARDFKKGETVRQLGGEVYNKSTVLDKIKKGELNNDDPLQIAQDKYIILDEDSRQINHSCEPNAGIRGESELIARHDIKAGEEITYDYSTTAHPDITPDIWTMPCQCGAECCRRNVQNISTISSKQLTQYLTANIVPEYLISEAQKKASLET